MGLDIYAVSQTAGNFLGPRKQFSEDEQDELLENDNVVLVYSTDFEERLDGYPDGLYRVRGESHSFRAGSYSWYNAWRRHLSLMALEVEPEDVWADPEDYAGRPFVELINFTDCGGTIGPRTGRKLADDFRNNAGRAEAYLTPSHPDDPNQPRARTEDDPAEEWLELYREFQRAFELAAQDGFVVFR